MRTDGLTDGETDMTKLIVAFRNFANASKNWQWCSSGGHGKQTYMNILWPTSVAGLSISKVLFFNYA